MGFQIMGGTRIVDAAAGLMGNLSKLEQEKLERKNKQFDRELQIRALELDEMKTKKTLELGEKELAVKSKYYQGLINKYARAGELNEKDIFSFVSGSGLDDIDGIRKQDYPRISLIAKEIMDNQGLSPDAAIKQATIKVGAENQANKKPGFPTRVMNWFKGLGGGDTIPIEE